MQWSHALSNLQVSFPSHTLRDGMSYFSPLKPTSGSSCRLKLQTPSPRWWWSHGHDSSTYWYIRASLIPDPTPAAVMDGLRQGKRNTTCHSPEIRPRILHPTPCEINSLHPSQYQRCLIVFQSALPTGTLLWGSLMSSLAWLLMPIIKENSSTSGLLMKRTFSFFTTIWKT